MLNIVICDDNSNILNKFAKMLESIFIKNNFEAQISLCSTDASEVVNYFNHNRVDVLFLDINLKSNMSGLEVASKLREIDKNAYLIFTTGHLEYAMMAYKLKTFDFLPKPITLERLEETIIRLFDDVNNSPKRYLNLGNNKMLINEDDIYYIKRDGMKLAFVTADSVYEFYNSFNHIIPKLPGNFIRCHKSYIANVNKIENIQNNSVIMFDNNEKCYIGPKYKNNLLEVLNK